MFDSVRPALDVMDAHQDGFEQRVPRLVEQSIGLLGMEPLGRGIILKSRTVAALEAVR